VINLRLLPRPEVPGYVQREMKNIFSGEFVDYLNVREIVKKLDIFREYASDMYQEGDINAAMAVLRPVIEAIIDNYTNLDDNDGLMRNFFAMVMDLYGDIVPNFRLDGERRRRMNQASGNGYMRGGMGPGARWSAISSARRRCASMSRRTC